MEPVAKSTPKIEQRSARRWWWIVLALALGLGAYLGWRTQNYGDPRYVGQWRVMQDYSGQMSTRIVFDADGSGRMFQLIDVGGEHVEKPIQNFLWGVENERLLVDNNPNAGKLSVSQRVWLMVNTWLYGQQPGWQTLDYRVTEVESDHLMLMGTSESSQLEHFEIVKVVE